MAPKTRGSLAAITQLRETAGVLIDDHHKPVVDLDTLQCGDSFAPRAVDG